MEIEQSISAMVKRLTFIREIKAELSREETELSLPLLTDVCLVGNIYDLFVSIVGKRIKKRSMAMDRKMFIFVILYFYCPSSIAGFKIKRGLREKIAEVLDCTCSNISHDYKDVGFYYQTYRKFRTDVNTIISRIKEQMGV